MSVFAETQTGRTHTHIQGAYEDDDRSDGRKKEKMNRSHKLGGSYGYSSILIYVYDPLVMPHTQQQKQQERLSITS